MEQWDAGRKNKEAPHNVAGSEAPLRSGYAGDTLFFMPSLGPAVE